MLFIFRNIYAKVVLFCAPLSPIFQYTGDVFAGVGPIAIAAAKRVRYVYANDLNPNAVDFLQKNCVINKLERKIEVRVMLSHN